MIIKYHKTRFENLPIRQIASETYNILKTEKKHGLSKHVWGDTEIYFPLENSKGMNIVDNTFEFDELYRHSEKPPKGQEFWYSISILPNMMMRRLERSLCKYEIKKKGNEYLFGVVFETRLTPHLANKHKEISDIFEQKTGIRRFNEDDCIYFMSGVSFNNSYNETAHVLADKIINFYDKYHEILIEVIKKHAPKFIERSGYIYE